MRSTCRLLLPALALLAVGCDRHSGSSAQGDDASGAPSNDEVQAGAPSASLGGRIDRSHAGNPAPSLAFSAPDGKSVTLAALRGKPVLVNLWATWCAPCVKELPKLNTLAANNAATLQVVTINEDSDATRAATFLAGRKLTFLKPYTDPKMAWVPAVAASLPTSILVGRDGREVWRVTGDLDWTGSEATKALAQAR